MTDNSNVLKKKKAPMKENQSNDESIKKDISNFNESESINDGVKILPILPLRNSVFFPGGIIPIAVGRAKTISLLNSLESDSEIVGIITQKNGDDEDPKEDDLYPMGTSGRILKQIKIGEDSYHLVVMGMTRFKVKRYLKFDPYILAEVEDVKEEKSEQTPEIEALLINLKKAAVEAFSMIPQVPDGAAEMIQSISEANQLCDIIASNIDASVQERIKVLETISLKLRLKLVLKLLYRKLDVLRISNKIDDQIKGKIDKNQREYFLRQQLKAIREELGDIEGEESDLEELNNKLKQAELPPDVEKVAKKEFNRLNQMQPQSAEYTVARTYLDWIADLPWSKSTKDKLAIDSCRKELNDKHYDLEKVKKRILEYLAVRKLKSDMKGPILCLVGPPGVGKTSLGQAIASAMGKEFIRISLGGVHDEAEIRGHRRTYVGALPGRIIQGIKKTGSNNPVFMMDEIDKLGKDFRGDPSSALLEVLDPEQNFSFSDHYLDVPFDLSKVMFIATANVADTIPPALRDRMELIELPGYIHHEKINIAKRFIIPKQLDEHGLTKKNLIITKIALDKIIESYTREAGVRGLERCIAAICRNVAVQIAEEKATKKTINKKHLNEILGPDKFYSEVAERTELHGVATGLAWTPAGGDILFIESTSMSGKGKLNLTGQLGDVMKESAQAALSLLRSKSEEFGFDSDFMEKSDLHIHVPAGSIPKDGPSAGVTIFISLLSLLTKRNVRHDIAMTGEITLRGLILPVGGIKEKVLAAHRAGIKMVLLPIRNENDLVDIPEDIKNEMNFKFVKQIDDAINLVFKKTNIKGGKTKT